MMVEKEEDVTHKRIVAVGDSYMTVELFVDALKDRKIAAEARTVDFASQTTWSTSGLREFEGDPAQVSEFLAGCEVVVLHGAPITRQVLEANPSLRYIACARGGPVNIDVEAARELGVTVSTTPGKNAEAVADLTIGFAISLLRNVMPSSQSLTGPTTEEKPGNFEGAEWFGREIANRRLGLVGLGHVARLVATRASALGVEVYAYDPYVGAGEVPHVTRVDSFDELLKLSEVLSLHARESESNQHLMGAREFSLMQDNAVFINTARESLVDEAALLEALRSGRLAGAALDVTEADGPRQELLDLPSVIMTPHIAGASFETLMRGASMVAEDIETYLSGETPQRAL